MRVLFLLQGIPGSGKSTFLKDNHLEQYAISTDQLRLLYGNPVMDIEGEFGIDQKQSSKAFSLLNELVEHRMKTGDMIIVDATHCTRDSLNKYREMTDKYRYRTYVVTFDKNLMAAIRNDKEREPWKRVGAQVITRMYENLKDAKVGWAEYITSDELRGAKRQYLPEDMSKYKKIVHFGDLQGCYEPVKKYFDENPFNEETLYIFVGDLVDRGIENHEVIKFMLSIYRKPNVIIVEGNHEHHLNCWANGQEITSDEFKQRTQPQLEEAGIDKKDVRQLYRKTRQMLYYTYNAYSVLVSHAGLPKIPSSDEFLKIKTQQFIKGVGTYEFDIDLKFEQSCEKNEYQVHGHRNAHHRPLRNTQNSFNLEAGVEFGGHLRIAELTINGWKTIEIQNTTFDIKQERGHHPNLEPNEQNMVMLLRGNTNVIEKKMDNNISSFNFDKETFYEGLWNAQTVKARGLFINTATNKIVARSYEKFFNIDEMESTSLARLRADMQFPVRFWDKENGFLGIVGYDATSDELVVASKSSVRSDFAGYFKKILESKVNLKELKKWMADKNFSLVFEVIDVENDPHIIEYGESMVVLLDIVYNELKFQKAPHEYVETVGRMWNLPVKTMMAEVATPDELEPMLKFLSEKDSNADVHTEGYVLEDSKGFMTKLKLPYYNFWKWMRGVKEQLYKNPNSVPVYENSELANEFVQFLIELPLEELQKDIIYLRKKFYERTGPI